MSAASQKLDADDGEAAGRRDVRNEWRAHWPIVAVCGLALGLSAGPTFSLGTFIVPLNQALGWSATEVVFVQTMLAAIVAVLLPAAGFLLDRFGQRLIAILGFLIITGSLAGLALMPSTLPAYYALWAALSVGTVLLSPMVLLKPIFECFQRTPALACSVALLGTNVAMAIAPLITAYLIDNMGWRAGFAGLAIYMFASGVPLLIWLLLGPRGQRKKADDTPAEASAESGLLFVDAIRTRVFWLMILSFFLAGGSGTALIIHLVPLLIEGGVSSVAAAGAVSVLGMAGLAGRLIAGALMDRIFVPRMAAVLLLLPVPALVALAGSSIDYSTAVMAAVVLGLLFGAEYNLVSYLAARYFGKRSLGTIGSLMFSAWTAGCIVIPLMISVLHDQLASYTVGLLILGLFFILAALAMVFCPRYPASWGSDNAVSNDGHGS